MFKKETNKRLAYLEEQLAKLDIDDYLAYKFQSNANEEAAKKQGYFYLNSNTDSTLLEKLIQEVNKDPDLAVMLRTADGTVLTLRSYPVSLNQKINKYEGGVL